MSKRTLVECSLFLVAVIWALNFSIIKNSLDQIDPFSFNAIRFLFAAGLIWAVLLWRGERIRIPRKDWPGLLAVGALGNLVYQGLFIIGLDYTLSANAAVMLGTIPVWVAIFSHFLALEKLTLPKMAGVVFACSGIALIITGSEEGVSFNSSTFWGDLIIIAAAMVWGIYTIISKSYLSRYTPLQFSAIMAAVGAAMLFIVGLPGLFQLEWSAIDLPAYGGVLYSGLLSIGVAYLIWNYGLQTMGAIHTSTYQNLVPVMGLIFGVLLLNEKLTLVQYTGSGLVISGIVLARFKRKVTAAQTPTRY